MAEKLQGAESDSNSEDNGRISRSESLSPISETNNLDLLPESVSPPGQTQGNWNTPSEQDSMESERERSSSILNGARSSTGTNSSDLLSRSECVSPIWAPRGKLQVAANEDSPESEPKESSSILSRARSPVLAKSGSPLLVPILPSNSKLCGQCVSTVITTPPVQYMNDVEGRVDIVKQVNPNFQNDLPNQPRQPSSNRPENRLENHQPSSNRPENRQPSSNRPENRQPSSIRPENGQPSSNRPENRQPSSNRPENRQSPTDRPVVHQSPSNHAVGFQSSSNEPVGFETRVSIPLTNLTNIPNRISIIPNQIRNGTNFFSQIPNSSVPSAGECNFFTKASSTQTQSFAQLSASYQRTADIDERSSKSNSSSMPSTSGTNLSAFASNSPIPSTSGAQQRCAQSSKPPSRLTPKNLRSPQPIVTPEPGEEISSFKLDILKRAYKTLNLIIGELEQYAGQVPERLPLSFRIPTADSGLSEPKQSDMGNASTEQTPSCMEDESIESEMCNKENCPVPNQSNVQGGLAYPEKHEIEGENSIAVSNLLKVLAAEEENERTGIEEPGLTETHSNSGYHETSKESETTVILISEVPPGSQSEEKELEMDALLLMNFNALYKDLPSTELTIDRVGEAVRDIRTHINCFARFLILECRYPNRNLKYMEDFKLAYTTFKEEEYPRFMDLLNLSRAVLTAEDKQRAEDLFATVRTNDEYLRKLHYAYFMLRSHQLFETRMKVTSLSLKNLEGTLLSIKEWKNDSTDPKSDSDWDSD